MEIKRSIARAVVKEFMKDGVVLPPNTRSLVYSGVFITFDVDNLDSSK